MGQGGEKMKEVTISNGKVYLDGEKVECVKEYKIHSSAKEPGVAELTLVMDVKEGLIEP